MPKRITCLDSFRFFGAVLVVIFHYALYSAGNFPAMLLNGDYPLVDLFFLLSGFVMMHVYGRVLDGPRDYVGFLQNRLARIYPLHLVTFLAYLAIGVASWRGIITVENPAKYDPQAVLPNLLMTHAWNMTKDITFNYPSWSISAEWAAYLIFPAVIWLARHGGPYALIAVSFSIVAVLETLRWKGLMPDWTLVTSDGGAVRAMPSFVLGAAVFGLLERYRPSIKTFTLAYVLFVLVLAGILFRVDNRVAILLFAATMAAAAAAEMNGARGIITSRFMVYMGDASYAMYMLHPLIGTVLITIVARRILHLEDFNLMLFCMLVAVPANLVIAPLVYSWFERPVRRALHTVGQSGRKKAAATVVVADPVEAVVSASAAPVVIETDPLAPVASRVKNTGR